MRTLTFEQITDGRFDEPDKLLELLNERIKLIKEKLNIDGLDVRVGEPYEVNWDTYGVTPAHSQWRVTFYVKKTTGVSHGMMSMCWLTQ